MRKTFGFLLIATLAASVLCASAEATIAYDQDVTPDVIFGSGNANGGFTTDRANGVELGLRAKLRFDQNNQPQNIFNSNGDGTYTFDPGLPPTGFGWNPNSPTTPLWNFEWSVNTDYDGSTGEHLDDMLSYELGIDFDPGPGTNFLTFDPILGVNPKHNAVLWDHAIGDNSTGNCAGLTAGDAATYATYLSSYNVAQNSWSYEFFNDNTTWIFDPTLPGAEYTIYLEAWHNPVAELVARTEITVLTTPEPVSMIFFGTGLVGVAGLVTRRRMRKAA